MKVLNICVNGAYTDGFSYQENLLPLYQKKIGYDVKILASNYEYDENGKLRISKKSAYIDQNGIEVKRLKIIGHKKLNYKFKKFENFYEEIVKIEPDIIFCHLCQFLDLKSVIRYVKKNKKCLLFLDSHADQYNSALTWISKKLLHGVIWRKLLKKSLPYVEKIYGTTPSRVDFLKRIYKIPSSKIEFLPFGVDDDMVSSVLAKEDLLEKRKSYGLTEKDILIVTGGKIDHNKQQILILMEAVNKSSNSNLKLIVFGSVSEEYKLTFQSLLSEKIQYIGWKKTEEIYKEFSVADIVAFPGLHSVFWEQAVGMKKPCIFRKIEGFNHIDLKGNCLFFKEDSSDSYLQTIQKAVESIDSMRVIASNESCKKFSYREIAKKSICKKNN